VLVFELEEPELEHAQIINESLSLDRTTTRPLPDNNDKCARYTRQLVFNTVQDNDLLNDRPQSFRAGCRRRRRRADELLELLRRRAVSKRRSHTPDTLE